MRLDLADGPFRAVAERWLRSLHDETIVDVAKLFRLSPGYYPTTLLELREAELWRRQLSSRTGETRISTASTALLPVSHPSDYDWRFTAHTAERLVEHACMLAPTRATVLHLGTPSTFIAGTKNQNSQAHVLVEANAAVVEPLASVASPPNSTTICLDLADGSLPQLKASCAILDPPWYPDYTLLFLTAAAEACAQGATILLCQPTDASRPGVQREQMMLLGTLPDPGLELTGHHRHWLRYETPHFERMSLRKLLPATRIPRDWRVGDLLALRKVAPRRLPGRPSVHVERWEEVRFGPVRIKLRPSQSAFEIEPLVPGDILDTVSRRDQIRQRIGMWTSGNRVYGIMNPRLVGTLINCCQNDWRLQRFSLDQIIAHADGIGVDAATAARLFTALKVELSEHG